mmetsp:Transcript_21201/g.21986  ORF Transcript_21201/g.21986 Transcript_21201/m.21986 type:complete len:196 (-) Transcript_21201:156-743(-)
MKITNALSIKVVTLLIVFAIALSNSDKKFLELEGTSNNYGGKTTNAVNSAYAKTNNKDVVLTNDPYYKTPTLAMKLPLRRPISSGPPESADEIPSVENYYDGSMGVKHSASFCQQFITKPEACVNQGNCGWCYGEGTCIGGNSKGPISNKDCLRGKYVYEAPSPNWNPINMPNTKLSRANVMGAQLTTIVQQGKP